MKISEERARDHGEVLTPPWMVEQMLAPLRAELLGGARTLDLCSGRGAFIIDILQNQLAAVQFGGATELYMILKNLYGFELLLDNVIICRAGMLDVVQAWVAAHGLADAEVVLAQAAEIITKNLMQLDVLATGDVRVPRWSGTEPTCEMVALAPGFFDIIVANPPYQRSIAALGQRNQSKSTPLYHFFYDFARGLQPRFISFIIPAKWYTGGWGLDRWRVSVLGDRHIKLLHDYRDSHVVFPTAEVNGGVCWLLWARAYVGDARVVRFDRAGLLISDVVRPLMELGADFFIRHEAAISILRKVGSFQLSEHERFSDMILGTTPFGLNSNFGGYSVNRTAMQDVCLYYIKEREYWVDRAQVTHNRDLIDVWKIFLPLSYNQYSAQIIGQPKVYGPGTVCTHSYLAIHGFGSGMEAAAGVAYMKTRFFRFLAHQLKISPIATRQVYRLIPRQTWDRMWTDEMLYVKYGLTAAEIEHIETTITVMV